MGIPSVDDFRNWLNKQGDIASSLNVGKFKNEVDYSGYIASPRVSGKKMLQKIETTFDDPRDMIVEFIEEGGIIVSADDDSAIVEVSLGQFTLPRFCVKITKPQREED